MQMSDEQRAQFTAQLEKQQAAGLVPQDDTIVVTQGGTASAVGTPPEYTEREDDGSIAGSAQTLGGIPTRLRHDSDLSQVTVEVRGIRMRASDAEQHGFLFRTKDGKLSFADQMSRVDEQRAQASGQPEVKPDAASGKPSGQPESSPEAQAAAEDQAAMGQEVQIAEQALQQHASMGVADLTLALLRGDEAKVDRALTALTASGLVGSRLEAYEWCEGVQAAAMGKLEGMLNQASLDGPRLITHILQDRNLTPAVERAALQFIATGDIHGFAPVLEALSANGTLQKFIKVAQGAAS